MGNAAAPKITTRSFVFQHADSGNCQKPNSKRVCGRPVIIKNHANGEPVSARAMGRARSSALSAASLALGRLPWRGKVLAWTCPRCPARPHEHSHSSLSDADAERRLAFDILFECNFGAGQQADPARPLLRSLFAADATRTGEPAGGKNFYCVNRFTVGWPVLC